MDRAGIPPGSGSQLLRSSGIGISNTPELCAKELMEYYQSDRNDCLISCGGGELMCEILGHMDFEALRSAAPKWYMGVFGQHEFHVPADHAVRHGLDLRPLCGDFRDGAWHESLEDTMDLLTGRNLEAHSYRLWEKESLKDEENPLVPYHVTEPVVLRRWPDQDTEFSGRLLGGCVDCLVNLTGTEFDRVQEFAETYREDGIIWFLECCDLNVMAIRRAFWQMEHAGWFRHVRGFLIGRPRELAARNSWEWIRIVQFSVFWRSTTFR